MSGPVRIQRQRTKGWRMPPTAVYVGRPTKWGNPFRCGPHGRAMSLAEKVAKFRDHIEQGGGFYSPGDEHVGKPKVTVDDIRRELRGKDLACWCSLDQPCHADVLLELANAPEALSA